MKNHFSIQEAITFGWHKVKGHSALIFQLILALFALQVVSAIVQKVLEGTLLGGLSNFALGVLSTFVGTGVMLITLNLARGDHAHFNQILPPWRLVWKYFCAGIVVGFLTLLPFIAAGIIGMTLLLANFPDIVSALISSPDAGEVVKSTFMQIQHNPTLVMLFAVLFAVATVSAAYLALRYSMSRYAIIDGAGIIESVRKSAKLTHGVKWHLLGLGLALVLLNIVGMLALLVGLLVTIPVTMLAMAHVYLKLKAHHS